MFHRIGREKVSEGGGGETAVPTTGKHGVMVGGQLEIRIPLWTKKGETWLAPRWGTRKKGRLRGRGRAHVYI